MRTQVKVAIKAKYLKVKKGILSTTLKWSYVSFKVILPFIEIISIYSFDKITNEAKK